MKDSVQEKADSAYDEVKEEEHKPGQQLAVVPVHHMIIKLMEPSGTIRSPGIQQPPF